MSNTILTDSVIAKEFIRTLRNKCVGLSLIHRGYDKEFQARKIGATVTVGIPARYAAIDGPTITAEQIQAHTEESVDITLDQHKTVPMSITTHDRTLKMDKFRERVIEPAIIPIADAVDTFIFGTLYKQVFHFVGQPGTDPSSFMAIGAAAQRLTEMGVPYEDRRCILNPAGRWAMADALKGVFNPTMASDLLKKGFIGRSADMSFHESNNIARHTAGAGAAAPLVKGASQTGASIITDAWGTSQSDVLLAGDVITFAGCYAVKPVSGAALPYLKQFVVTADVDSDAVGTGEATVAISPAIVVTGARKNCSASPTNDGAITLVASHAANLAFHKNAMALCMAPLAPLEGGSKSYQMKSDGIVILITGADNILTLDTVWRLDVLFGGKVIHPEMACRIAGA